MWKAIDIDKLDNLLKDFNNSNNKSFSKFVEEKDDFDWVDSVGVVTPEDFENDFSKEFIKKNFKDLAGFWFAGLNSQVDFGVVLDCVKDNMQENNQTQIVLDKENKNGNV